MRKGKPPYGPRWGRSFVLEVAKAEKCKSEGHRAERFPARLPQEGNMKYKKMSNVINKPARPALGPQGCLTLQEGTLDPSPLQSQTSAPHRGSIGCLPPLLEVCCGSFYSACQAVLGGARRIELCQALSLDGLTPSIGLLQAVRERYPDLCIHVLVRSVEGPFVYSAEEVALMERDICAAVRAGADGIVVGALTPGGDIDLEAARRWVAAADGRPVTFHRAFDRCHRPQDALEQLIDLGCARVLTSGQASTAESGIPLLRQLVQQAAGRIIILPGGGVNSGNARRIIQATATTEIHGSASRPMPDGRKETDAAQVRDILQALAFDN